jgi:hypothetical protein
VGFEGGVRMIATLLNLVAFLSSVRGSMTMRSLL